MVTLHDLAGKGDLEGVRKVLAKSAAKVNQTNRDGQTALHSASKGGHVEVCRELLAAVASVDAEDAKHRTPLLIAVENNKPKVVKVLCEAGASTSIAAPADGRQALHLAACHGFVECAEVLLQHGAPIDGNPDKWGRRPEENCAVSEIRSLISTARRDRSAATSVGSTSPYRACAASAPSPTDENEGTGGKTLYQSSSPLGYPPSLNIAAADGKPESRAGKELSPLSQALKDSKVGGDFCAGCNAPERSRQLTPCHHVVCRACARRARDEQEDGCTLCHTRVFDDNPVFM